MVRDMFPPKDFILKDVTLKGKPGSTGGGLSFSFAYLQVAGKFWLFSPPNKHLPPRETD